MVPSMSSPIIPVVQEVRIKIAFGEYLFSASNIASLSLLWAPNITSSCCKLVVSQFNSKSAGLPSSTGISLNSSLYPRADVEHPTGALNIIAASLIVDILTER